MWGTKRRQGELLEAPRVHLGEPFGQSWLHLGRLWSSLGLILGPFGLHFGALGVENGAQMAPGSGFLDIAKTLKFLEFFDTF